MTEAVGPNHDPSAPADPSAPGERIAGAKPIAASKRIVDVTALKKVYRSGTLRRRGFIEALCGVSLQAHQGDVFGLLGPNGAGKTTLIKILLGIVKPSGGQARMFDLAVGSAAARRRVGYLPEALRIDPHHTARSALNFYGQLSRMPKRDIRRRSDHLLELVGLRDRDRESVHRFSKGMRQRLGLACALVHDPDLLVLDEPTDGLDPVGRSDVRRVIERLRDTGKTIFLNSHLLQEVELICTRVAIMSRGQIRAIGPIERLGGDHDTKCLAIEVHDSRADLEQSEDLQRARLSACCEAVAQQRWSIDRLATAGVFRITLGLPNQGPFDSQTQIDRIVDRLRADAFSIVDLRMNRPTLEDTFLRLIAEEGEPSLESTADFDHLAERCGQLGPRDEPSTWSGATAAEPRG